MHIDHSRGFLGPPRKPSPPVPAASLSSNPNNPDVGFYFHQQSLSHKHLQATQVIKSSNTLNQISQGVLSANTSQYLNFGSILFTVSAVEAAANVEGTELWGLGSAASIPTAADSVPGSGSVSPNGPEQSEKQRSQHSASGFVAICMASSATSPAATTVPEKWVWHESCFPWNPKRWCQKGVRWNWRLLTSPNRHPI